MTLRTSDAVVVGAGVVGAACARAMAAEGILATLVESATIGGSATAAGMGHLVVMDDSEAQFALTRYSQQLWDEVLEELPDDCEYQNCGTIWVAADDEEMVEVHRKQQFYQSRDVEVEVLDTAAIARAEPNLRANLAGGLRVPGDSVIYPPCAARWMIERAIDRGTLVRTGLSVVEINGRDVKLSDGSTISAGAVVVATGACAVDLVPGLPMRARKGHLVITDRYPGFVNHQLIELGYLKSAHSVGSDSVAFNLQPRITGQLLLGSSRQYDDRSSDVVPDMLGRMIRRGQEYMPSLGSLQAVRTWTGFRAATEDKLPLIGPVPESENVYLATGHEGLGISMATGTAALVVDQLMDRDSKIPREPYLPSRFGSLTKTRKL